MTDNVKSLDDHKFNKLIQQRNDALNEAVNLYAQNNALSELAHGYLAEIESLKARLVAAAASETAPETSYANAFDHLAPVPAEVVADTVAEPAA